MTTPPPRPGAADAPASGGSYRIATVSERTGVPEPTLRAWERRYGIPAPARAASGYRLYEERDIELVREMRRLCDAGMAAAEAAELLRARHGEAGAAAVHPTADPQLDAFALSVEAILDAVTAFDDVALERQVRRLLFLGRPGEVLDRVIVPVLTAVGERWHAGELGVAQEHLVTQKVGAVLRDFTRLLPGIEAERAVVLASFADDEHEIGPLGLAVKVSEWGLRPVFLGARTPPSALRGAVEAASPVLVALSVSMTPARPRARELVDEYASACAGCPWVVGGLGVDGVADLVERRGGQVVRGPAAGQALAPLLRQVGGPRARRGSR